jgi:hypothetical protein
MTRRPRILLDNCPEGLLAPSWLPRQQRRRVDRELRKLVGRSTCSICGISLQHNSRTTGGLDIHNNVVLAGECCVNQVAITVMLGYFVDRQYDFLLQHATKLSTDTEPTNAQIIETITAYQKAVAAADKRFDDIVRRGGGAPTNGITLKVNPPDGPWKEDDRNWFKQNPQRSHRARLPFPDEADKEAARSPAGHTMVMLVRQVEPGNRLKVNFYLAADELPVPNDEALIHTLFEIAMRREPFPPNAEAFHALVVKYRTQEPGQ